MKKTSLMILAMLFIAANIAVAQSESDEAYIKAMKSKKYIQNLKKYPEIRFKLLHKFNNE